MIQFLNGLAEKAEAWWKSLPKHLHAWWEGYDYLDRNEPSEDSAESAEDMRARIAAEAERIRNRANQAKTSRAYACAMLTGDRLALFETLKQCLESSKKSALELKENIESGFIDPQLLFNAVEKRTLRAKQTDTDEIVTRRLYSMRIEIIVETLLGMLDAYQQEDKLSEMIRNELPGLKREILKELINLEKTFGKLTILTEAISYVRPLVPAEGPPSKPSRSNLASGLRGSGRFGR